MADPDADEEGIIAKAVAPMAPPIAPKIGGLYMNYQWTGGKPTVAWDATENREPESPFCYRFDDPAKQLKSYQALTTCSTTKFKRNDASYTLPSFLRDITWHTDHAGMDSVFYFVNPADTTERLSILSFHSRFTTAEVTNQLVMNRANGTYDKFDEANLKMSYVWLSNALDETLLAAVRPQFREKMTGPELFMIVVSEVQSDSIRSLRKKERVFEQLALAQFPAENVKNLNNQILDTCDELERAGSLPDDAILTITEKYCAATSEEFKIHFLTRRSNVEDHLKAIAGKDASVVAALPNRITFRSLAAESNEKYQGLLDNGAWMPANADKGAAPQAFMTQADVEGLLKQKLDKGGGMANITCFNCGQKGHVANKCTHGSNIPAATPPGTGGGTPAGRAWMRVQPPTGTPETKVVNGKTWHWCEQCNRWSTTHSTSTHRSKPTEGDTPPAVTPPPAAETNRAAIITDSLVQLGNFGGAW